MASIVQNAQDTNGNSPVPVFPSLTSMREKISMVTTFSSSCYKRAM